MRNILKTIFLPLFILTSASFARAPLSYVAEPEGLYSPAKPDGIVTILDLIRSRSDLSKLAEIIEMPAGSSLFGKKVLMGFANNIELQGFSKAFNTYPSWNFTFFAPSDEAFNNTGSYYVTYSRTPKGVWWTGNVINHHYIPNTALKKKDFNGTLSRVQAASYLYIGAQISEDILVLNGVAEVIEADIPVTNGVVHIIDRILDPSAQIFEKDLPKVDQKFIAGSCSNPELSYC